MARTCWQYILKALGWARKYGLRVKIDLHTIPGSQNGELLFHVEAHRRRGTRPTRAPLPEATNPLIITRCSFTDFPSPSPLALRRVKPFRKSAKWAAELAQRGYGYCKRSEGS